MKNTIPHPPLFLSLPVLAGLLAARSVRRSFEAGGAAKSENAGGISHGGGPGPRGGCFQIGRVRVKMLCELSFAVGTLLTKFIVTSANYYNIPGPQV